ncbi:HAD family hydrolase, partial [Vibrio parahaemolyticus]
AFSVHGCRFVYACGDTHEEITMRKMADDEMLNWSEWRASE